MASPCCRRRRARARPPACRWRCWTPGCARAASSCWSRAAWPPAPRPSGWPRRWARRRARPSATASAARRGCRAATRIEVVTEGILTRMIQSDPELTGIGAVIFDEFHERSLNADLGLALCLEVRGALREDLVLLADVGDARRRAGGRADGGAPVVTSEGRAFPVETRWLDAPLPRGARLEQAMADLIADGAGRDRGRRAGLPARRGRDPAHRGRAGGAAAGGRGGPARSTAPCPSPRSAPRSRRRGRGRKVVLATSIAETSLTIDGIRVVVDAGRARRARFDPGSGMSRLVTERVTPGRGRAARAAAPGGWRRGSATGSGPGARKARWPPSRRPRSRRRT